MVFGQIWEFFFLIFSIFFKNLKKTKKIQKISSNLTEHKSKCIFCTSREELHIGDNLGPNASSLSTISGEKIEKKL